jgi:uncharacterized metal-binding protein
MPSGRRHDSITLWTLPLVAGGTFVQTHSSTLTLLVSGGFLFSGLMFGPDLDIYSRHYQRWGWLRWIWLPYRRRMRHRSFWSHGPVVGTAGRILYVGAWLGLVALVVALGGAIAAHFLGKLPLWHGWVQRGVAWGSGVVGRSLQRDMGNWLALLLGLELGAMSHSLCDGLGTLYRRLWGPRSPAKGQARTQARLQARIQPSSQSTRPSSPQSGIQPSGTASPSRPGRPVIMRIYDPRTLRRSSAAGLRPPSATAKAAKPFPPTDPAARSEPQLPSFGRWLRR